MFKEIFDSVQKLLLLAHETKRNRDDVDDLYTRVERLGDKVQALAYEIQRINEREQHEREKFRLQVENALLRFERLLPPPGGLKKGK